jgi:hypothetical protein
MTFDPMGFKPILERALKVFGLCKSITLIHKWMTFHPMRFKAPFEGGLRFMQVHHFCFTNEWLWCFIQWASRSFCTLVLGF